MNLSGVGDSATITTHIDLCYEWFRQPSPRSSGALGSVSRGITHSPPSMRCGYVAWIGHPLLSVYAEQERLTLMASRRPMARRAFLLSAAVGAPALLAACGRPQQPDSVVLPAADASASATMPPIAIETSSKPVAADRQPQVWGTHMPGISTHVVTVPGRRTMALTFDACGGSAGSGYDAEVIAALREFAVPATLFLNERWMNARPAETADLVADPLFQIENHGTSHLPLSVTGQAAYGITGTTDAAAAAREIESNRSFLRRVYGVDSAWFRSGTAHYDDVAVEIAHSLGIRIAGFATNADAGATAPVPTVTARMVAAPDGAIVLAHMNQPGKGTAPGTRNALATLRAENVNFVHLN